MDVKDVYHVGSGIMDAVNDAVTKQDFSGLNEALRNVTGTAAGQAADALYRVQDHLQGSGQGSAGGNGPGGAGGNAARGAAGEGAQGERTYGHAGRSSTNVTQEYMQRAAGARHHERFASRLSPFLQRQVSRGSGTGRIIGGVVSFVFAGFFFLETAAAGLLGAVVPGGGGFFTAWTIFSLIVTGALAVLGGILVKSGKERRKLVREYYEYGRIAGTAEYLEISRLAEAVGESRETVLANLEKMMSEEMLPAAWFDRQKTTLMLSERMYNEYLRLERERQEQEAEEAKARMQAGGPQSAAGAGAAAYGENIPDDLKLRPEDEKLPQEAKKIVEEGLLYMTRIRGYNRLIGDEDMSMKLSQLESTMDRILDQIRKDPGTAPNLRRLMVYYLPTTMKLLEAYVELDAQPLAGENVLSTRREIREALGTINVAFENLLDSLFQDMAWDISSDISVMKTMMAQDGLTGEGIRKAQEGGAVEETSSAAGAQPGGGLSGGPESFDGRQARSQAAVPGGGFSDGYSDGFSEGLEENGGISLKFGE